MANLGIDIQVCHHQFAFHGHVKYPLTTVVPVHFNHFQGDIVTAILNRQFVAEYVTVAFGLIDSVIFRIDNRIRGTGDGAVGREFVVRRIDDSVFIRVGGCADPHRNGYAVFLPTGARGTG